MALVDLLEAKKETICKKWFETVISDYAPDAAAFFQNTANEFANPVGATARKCLDALFDALLSGREDAAVAGIIDPMIRIRAVQAFSPSRATGFVFSLKPIVREVVKKHRARESAGELIRFEARIDRMALVGFDVFMQCREKIYELKTNEERSKTYKAFARAGLIKDVNPEEPNLKFI